MIPSVRILVDKVRSLPAGKAAPRLLNAADKDLALVLFLASEADLRFILGYLSPQKQLRVQEEVQRMQHVRFNPKQYDLALKHLLGHLESHRPLSPIPTHLKPNR
jgi:hypothetical protein